MSLDDDLRPDDLRLLRLAEDCWRPLGLGKAFANWMSHVVDAYVRARLRELVSRVSAIVTVHHLLLRWLQWCVFAQERQDRRLAAEHVERNRMMRAALQACRQWCGRQHEKRAAELIEWKCARCAQRYSQTVAGCDVSARGSARFTGGPGRYGARRLIAPMCGPRVM